MDPGPDALISEGDLYLGQGKFADPGDDQWVVFVDYGDGSSIEELIPNTAKSFDLKHTYPKPGSYVVQATVLDDDLGLGIDTITVTVEALPDLTVRLVNPPTIL